MDNEYYKRYEPFFGAWYIKRYIGAGSYGKVFEIERRDEFDTVFTGALKAITIPSSPDELEEILSDGMDRDGASTYFRDYVKDLNREIALMSKLKGHSNIVSYEDHAIHAHEDGIGWDILIRMELLTPITGYLKQNKSFTRREIIRLGIDLCRALEVCQRYNIIHRDIKPANIFISETEDFKLGDFGVARIASASTGASTRAGTVNYMAPEVFKGEKYTSNVDIYSLGLVMYQLLNANRMPLYPPYPQPMSPAQRERAQAQRLSGAALPPPANADGRLAEIVLKACAPDPAQRYDSPAVMRQALEAILYTEGEARVIYPGGDAVPVPGTSGTADLQPAPAPAKNVPDEGTIRPVPARAPESPAQEPETADGGTIGAPVPGWNDAAPAQEPAGTVRLMAAPFQPEAAEQPAAAPEKDGTVRLMAAPAEVPAQEQAPAQPTEPETPAEESAPAEALPEDETICIAAAEKAPAEPAPAPADDRTERIAVPATVPAAVPEEPEADRTTFLFEAQAEKRRQEQQAKREAEEAARRKAAEEKEEELARIRAEKRAAEQERLAAEKAEAEAAAAAEAPVVVATAPGPKKAGKGKKVALAVGGVAVAAAVAVGAAWPSIQQKMEYSKAAQALANGDYGTAITVFGELGDYEDSAAQLTEAEYQQALAALKQGDYANALTQLQQLKNYKDAEDQAKEAKYQLAVSAMKQGDYESAITQLGNLKGYKDAETQWKEAKYQNAKKLLDAKNYTNARSAFSSLNGYKDSADLYKEATYQQCKADKTNATQYINLLDALGDYKDSAALRLEKMSQYVNANKNASFTSTRKICCEYLKDLIQSDSATWQPVYNEMFSWKITDVYWNTSADSTTQVSSIKSGSPVYFHFTISGGEPGASTMLYRRVFWSDGDKSGYNSFNYEYEDGDSGYVYWDKLSYKGKVTIKIYDGNKKEIGSGSVTMK